MAIALHRLRDYGESLSEIGHPVIKDQPRFGGRPASPFSRHLETDTAGKKFAIFINERSELEVDHTKATVLMPVGDVSGEILMSYAIISLQFGEEF